MIRRGFVYWIHFDKWRPGLVLSVDARNDRANDIIAVPCSTNLREAPTHVHVRRGIGGLPGSSVVKCEQVTTINKINVRPDPLDGPMPPHAMRAIEQAIQRAIGIPIPMVDSTETT